MRVLLTLTLLITLMGPSLALAEISGPARVIDGDTIEIAGERIYHVPGGAYYDRTALVLHRGGSAGGGMAEV